MESVCVYLRIASIDSAFQIMTVRSAPPDVNLVPENKYMYMNVNIQNSRKSTQHINYYHVLNYLHTLVPQYTEDTTDIHQVAQVCKTLNVHVHKVLYSMLVVSTTVYIHYNIGFYSDKWKSTKYRELRRLHSPPQVECMFCLTISAI